MIFKSPFFSVVIPLYNKGNHVAGTLASVLRQTFSDFEVIVVDDGSTDQGLEVVRSCTDARVSVLTQENMGVSAARNHGIRRAKSEYIAFLDADDLWEPTYLDQMRQLLERYPEAGIYVAAYKIAKKNKVYDLPYTLPEGVVDNYFKAELEQNITRLSAMVVPRAICEQVGGFPLGMVSGEDSFFCGKIAIQHQVVFTPKVLVVYNQQFSGLRDRYFRGDSCSEKWYDMVQVGDFYRNEFIANKVINAGIRSALASHKEKSKEIEVWASYTTLFRKKWKYLYFLNRMPASTINIYREIKPFISFQFLFLTLFN
jgi:glycosyltransferase involved in cell wall biosynthesis